MVVGKSLGRGWLLILAAALGSLLISGCASDHGGASSQSSPRPAATPTFNTPSLGKVNPELRALLTTVQSELWHAYQRGRGGESFQPASPAFAALRQYIQARPGSNLNLFSSRAALRDAIRGAFERGRSGDPFQPPPPIGLAIQRYIEGNPRAANRASRAIFVAVDGTDGTATKQGADALFWADGRRMWSAGYMAPGLNDGMFDLSRQSVDEPWQSEIITSAI